MGEEQRIRSGDHLRLVLPWRFDNSANCRVLLEKPTGTTKGQWKLKNDNRQSTLYDFEWNSDSSAVDIMSCLTLIWQDIVDYAAARVLLKNVQVVLRSWAKFFANVPSVGNILLISTLWTAPFKFRWVPKLIFNEREVLKHVVFRLPLSSNFPRITFFRFYFYFLSVFICEIPVWLSYSIS